MTYGDTNSNFYIALNHGLQTFVAMLVVFAGLFYFLRLIIYQYGDVVFITHYQTWKL